MACAAIRQTDHPFITFGSETTYFLIEAQVVANLPLTLTAVDASTSFTKPVFSGFLPITLP